jgi:cytochrome c biogenesis protein CcdA
LAELITILTTIALLDSASMITVATLPFVALLSMRRPFLLAFVFVLGTYVTYFACGVLVFTGLDSLFDALSEHFNRWWTHPDTSDLILELIIGVVLLVMAFLMLRSRKKPAKKREPKSASPVGVFLFAGFLVVVGMPGAVPLFAAIDQMLRADVSDAAAVGLLLYYNLVFVLPFVVIVGIRVAMGDRSDRVFDAVNRFLATWGTRMAIIVMLLLGLALVADSIGWMMGRSFIPVE